MDIEMALVPAVPPIFEEVTKGVGIPLNLSNESIAWGDLDGDNWLDLIVDGRIYKNEEGVGQGIKASGINRKELFATSKIWNTERGYETTLILDIKKALREKRL